MNFFRKIKQYENTIKLPDNFALIQSQYKKLSLVTKIEINVYKT